MARLNESAAPPAASAENLESLKRRFMRQNRELARSNTTQAIRIRQLELEICHLRTQNVNLTEKAISLETELQDVQAGRNPRWQGQQQVESIKKLLEGKLGEVMGMLSELGKAPEGTAGPRFRRRSQLPPGNVEKLSPNSRRHRRLSQKRALDLDAPNEEDEARLPNIDEDKPFPRRSLELNETLIANLNLSGSDSPDLGPPPTAYFDREPAKEEEQRPPTRDGSVMQRAWEENPQLVTALLSGNFETRRRRRSSVSTLTLNASAAEVSEKSQSSEGTTAENTDAEEIDHPIKLGAKRKWDSTRTSRPSRRQSATSEEFALNKFSASNEGTTSEAGATDTSRAKLNEPSAVLTNRPIRKALAPKPVNTDPVVSPVKQQATEGKDKPLKQPTSDKPTARSTSRLTARNRVPLIDPSSTTEKPVLEVAEIKIEQKDATNLDDDVFSPNLANDGQPETPPRPQAAGIEGPNGIRGSRRARPQISYAEPSLITKMRRPGKEMADAVTKDGRRTSASVQSDRKSMEPPSGRSVSTKRPREEQELSTTEPTSPSNRVSTASSESRARDLSARTSTARQDTGGAAAVKEESEDADVFDFVSSSPPATTTASTVSSAAARRKTSLSTSRRRTLDHEGSGASTVGRSSSTGRLGSAGVSAPSSAAAAPDSRLSDSEREGASRHASRSAVRKTSELPERLGRRRSMMV